MAAENVEFLFQEIGTSDDPQWLLHSPSFNISVTASTKDQAIREFGTSVMVLIAYQEGIQLPKEVGKQKRVSVPRWVTVNEKPKEWWLLHWRKKDDKNKILSTNFDDDGVNTSHPLFGAVHLKYEEIEYLEETEETPQTVGVLSDGLFSRKEVVALIDNLLEHSDQVFDAINNENTTWDGNALLSLSEESILSPLKIKQFIKTIEQAAENFIDDQNVNFNGHLECTTLGKEEILQWLIKFYRKMYNHIEKPIGMVDKRKIAEETQEVKAVPNELFEACQKAANSLYENNLPNGYLQIAIQKHFGRDFKPLKEDALAVSKGACPNCGYKNNPDTKVCKKCSQPVSTNTVESAELFLQRKGIEKGSFLFNSQKALLEEYAQQFTSQPSLPVVTDDVRIVGLIQELKEVENLLKDKDPISAKLLKSLGFSFKILFDMLYTPTVLTEDEINTEFRMIISHALLGCDLESVSKETWELVFGECTKFSMKMGIPMDQKEKRNVAEKAMNRMFDIMFDDSGKLPPFASIQESQSKWLNDNFPITV